MDPLILNLNELTKEQFLQDYWQQKPIVLRGALADFEDLISPDELAGLACEEAVESRLIYKKDEQWQAQSGPFETYDHLGEQDWSLVVQAADNWSPEIAQLAHALDFLPDWRRDDVMVSFATVGGSVGPHVDNYDTFICQGSGARHWRVGGKGQFEQFSAHELLLHVTPFEPIIDVELQAGDILYIPPGYPHEGIALSPSMSFSVGFRAHSAKDTLSALADHLIDFDLANDLLTDPKRPLSTHAGLIDNDDLKRVKQQLSQILQDDALLARFAGRYFSEPKHTLDAPQEPMDYTGQEIAEILQQQPLYRLGGLRCHYLEQSVLDGLFYINGEECQVDAALVEVVRNLCDNQTLDFAMLDAGIHNPEFLNLLTTFVNQGCWYFEGE